VRPAQRNKNCGGATVRFAVGHLRRTSRQTLAWIATIPSDKIAGGSDSEGLRRPSKDSSYRRSSDQVKNSVVGVLQSNRWQDRTTPMGDATKANPPKDGDAKLPGLPHASDVCHAG